MIILKTVTWKRSFRKLLYKISQNSQETPAPKFLLDLNKVAGWSPATLVITDFRTGVFM